MFFAPNSYSDYDIEVIDNPFTVAKLSLGFLTNRKKDLEKAHTSAKATYTSAMNTEDDSTYKGGSKIAKAEENMDLLGNMLEHLRQKATWEIRAKWKEARDPVTPAKTAYTKSLLAGIDWHNVLKWRNS